VADTSDPGAIAAAVTALAGNDPNIGVLTWDETVLEATARAAEKLGLPHMSADATALCRDKYATRTLMDRAGLASVRHRLVTTESDAVGAAREIGYPVVVKPRSLAGSVGVALAHDDQAVRGAFASAATARFPNLPMGDGVLIEEYLDGPEISVDSVVDDGLVRCVHVARKRLGDPPYFEEVGHLLTNWSGQPWAAAVRELVVETHRVLGVTHGVTHAEVRLTPAGPRLVELNGRLAGDLIPYASELATGIDLVSVAAELALGRQVPLTASRQRVAEIRFIYPSFDCVVGDIDVAPAAAVPGIAYAAALAEPGSQLFLPPRGVIPRLAALVAVGQDDQACERILREAQQGLTIEIGPIAE
jgi:biotin carboxylase